MPTAPAFQRSADTSLLVTLFSRANQGDIVTYDQIREMIGRDPQTHRQAIYSALRILQSETGKVFACESKVGYRCLNDSQIIASTSDIRERQHRLAGKGLKRLAAVNVSKLNESERKDFYVHLSVQGALRHVTAAKAQKTIESKVNGATQQLAVAMTLKALAE